MKLSCEVIKDLLPLYFDKVCSKESSALVEEHLSECPKCADELEKLKNDLEEPIILEGDIKLMKNISQKWKKDKKTSFAIGSMCISALAALICIISYHVIGAEVLPDGTLVEPFALIPIGYLFILLFIISFIFSIIFSRKSKKNRV